MGVTFKLIKYLGSVAKSDKAEKKLQICQWNGGDKVYDLRIWKADGKAASGISLSKEELLRIVELYKSEDKGTEVVEETEEEDLPINPPVEESATESDCVPETQPEMIAEEKEEEPVEEKEYEEPEDNLVQMPGTDIPQEEGRERGRKQSTNAEKPKEKSNIIKMPEPIEKAKTEGNATYDDCCEKLDKLFGDYAKNEDFAYVLTGLKELALVDNEFVQNVMRESRTFDGMMKYALNQARKIGMQFGNGAGFTNDQMLAVCIDYYSAKEEAKKEVKKSTTKSTTKKTTKPKAEPVEDENGIDLDNLFD